MNTLIKIAIGFVVGGLMFLPAGLTSARADDEWEDRWEDYQEELEDRREEEHERYEEWLEDREEAIEEAPRGGIGRRAASRRRAGTTRRSAGTIRGCAGTGCAAELATAESADAVLAR